MGTASDLVGDARVSPADVAETAEAALANATGDERVQILRALSVAYRELGELDRSLTAVEEAAGLARGEDQLAVELSMAATLAFQGEVERAREVLVRTVEAAQGEVRAEALFQLGTLHARTGEFSLALDCYGKALPSFRRYGKGQWVAHLLGNRGAIRMEVGDYRRARRDLTQALEFHDALGEDLRSVYLERNLAELDHLEGDLHRALQRYEATDPILERLGIELATMTDKFHTMIAVGLFAEVLELAHRSFAAHHKAGNVYGQVESLAYAAEAGSALGKVDQVEAVHALSLTIDGADEYPTWLARCALALVRARLRQGTFEPSDEERAERALAIVRDRGDLLRQIEALLTWCEVLMVSGRSGDALQVLDEVEKSARRMPLHVQLHGWLLRTRLREAGLDSRSVGRSIAAGLKVHAQLMCAVPSHDVRVHASAHGDRLLESHVRLCLDRGNLAPLERDVARYRVVRETYVPDASDSSADLRKELRRLATLRAQTGWANRALLQRERRVATVSRVAGSRMSPDEPRSEIHLAKGQSFVTFASDGRDLFAIHAQTSGREVHRCGSLKAVVELVERLAFAGRQLARTQSLSQRNVAAVGASHSDAAKSLGEVLMPKGLARSVVLSPTPLLQSVPWAMFGELAGRGFVIARSPDDAVWSSKGSGDVCVVASSELEHAQAEAGRVALHYGVEPWVSERGALIDSLDGAWIAHIAGHFVHRGDQPLLSSMPVDGEVLTGYDFVAMRQAPELVVLAGCSTVSASERGSDGVLGLASAAIAGGARCVIATVVPVEDAPEFVDVVDGLHAYLSQGDSPAEALRRLREVHTDGRRSFLASSLISIGAGLEPVSEVQVP